MAKRARPPRKRSAGKTPSAKRLGQATDATPAESGGVRYDDVRRLALEFPGIEESTSYGTPALKVRGALLTRLREDGETLVLKTTFVDRDLLLQADPDVYFLTDHYRNYPYVLIRLSRISLQDLRHRLEEAWTRARSRTR